MKTTLVSSSLVLVALVAGPILAQQPDQRDQTKVKDQSRDSKTTSDRTHSAQGMRSDLGFDHAFMDTDRDGRVSKSEFERSFSKLDANSDGYISSDEWNKADARSSNYRGTTPSDSTKPGSTKKP